MASTCRSKAHTSGFAEEQFAVRDCEAHADNKISETTTIEFFILSLQRIQIGDYDAGSLNVDLVC